MQPKRWLELTGAEQCARTRNLRERVDVIASLRGVILIEGVASPEAMQCYLRNRLRELNAKRAAMP